MQQRQIQDVITFLHEAERLKTVLRHSWLSSGRRESDAEHCWRMALMAILISPYLKQPVDLPKVLKMITVHELVEINYKDHWAFNKPPTDKEQQERKSLKKLVKSLPSGRRDGIINLWEEYQACKTAESLFAKFLDKTEVLLQHNEADIKFLNKKEIPLNLHHGEQYGEHDDFLRAFRAAINEETLSIYRKNKIAKELYKHYI